MAGTELILPNGDVVAVRDRRAGGGLAVRDPRGATAPTTFQSPTLPQVDEWNAEQAFRLGYAANVIAYRCTQLRARAISTVPLVAGKRMSDHKTINENAPITKLLGPPPGGPAPKMSARKLLRWTAAQWIVAGRYAWEIETDDRDIPVAFWPLATSSLRVHPTESGVEWFRLFEYGPSHDPVRFTPDEIFYGWNPSGTNFRQAETDLQAARYDLSLVTLCDRYSLGFLRNNAVPAAIVTTTQFPSEAARRKFVQNWSSEFGGPENAGRVAINEVGDDGDGPVGDSIDVKVLGLSAKDARLVEQRRDLMTEIAVALGTPWSKLDASGRTFANAEQEDLDWWENTILPDMAELQDDINMQLAPRLGGDVVWFDLRNVRALKRRMFAIGGTEAVRMLELGVIMPDEIRTDIGLEPLADGSGMQPIEITAGSDVPPITPTPVVPPTDATPPNVPEPPAPKRGRREGALACECNDPPAAVAGVCPVCGLPARAHRTAEGENRMPSPEETEQRRARIWRAADAVVTGLEGRWSRSWARMFTRQQQATLDRLTGKRGRQALGYGVDGQPLDERGVPQIDAESIFTRTFWENEARQLAADLYEETAAAGMSRLSMTFGVSFDVTARWVQDFIEARANQLAGQVTSTTYDAIQAELVAGVANGESIDDLATRVTKVFTQASQTRATTIARTEVVSAYNGSAVGGGGAARRRCRATWWAARSGSPPATRAPVRTMLPPTASRSRSAPRSTSAATRWPTRAIRRVIRRTS